jgi:hypothetical protein
VESLNRRFQLLDFQVGLDLVVPVHIFFQRIELMRVVVDSIESLELPVGLTMVDSDEDVPYAFVCDITRNGSTLFLCAHLH